MFTYFLENSSCKHNPSARLLHHFIIFKGILKDMEMWYMDRLGESLPALS